MGNIGSTDSVDAGSTTAIQLPYRELSGEQGAQLVLQNEEDVEEEDMTEEEDEAEVTSKAAASSRQKTADPFDSLSEFAKKFLRTVGIDTAETFLKTITGDIAQEYVIWRKKKGMVPLKRKGAPPAVRKWKARVRKAAKAMGKEEIAAMEPDGRRRNNNWSQDMEDEEGEEVDELQKQPTATRARSPLRPVVSPDTAADPSAASSSLYLRRISLGDDQEYAEEEDTKDQEPVKEKPTRKAGAAKKKDAQEHQGQDDEFHLQKRMCPSYFSNPNPTSVVDVYNEYCGVGDEQYLNVPREGGYREYYEDLKRVRGSDPVGGRYYPCFRVVRDLAELVEKQAVERAVSISSALEIMDEEWKTSKEPFWKYFHNLACFGNGRVPFTESPKAAATKWNNNSNQNERSRRSFCVASSPSKEEETDDSDADDASTADANTKKPFWTYFQDLASFGNGRVPFTESPNAAATKWNNNSNQNERSRRSFCVASSPSKEDEGTDCSDSDEASTADANKKEDEERLEQEGQIDPLDSKNRQHPSYFYNPNPFSVGDVYNEYCGVGDEKYLNVPQKGGFREHYRHHKGGPGHPVPGTFYPCFRVVRDLTKLAEEQAEERGVTVSSILETMNEVWKDSDEPFWSYFHDLTNNGMGHRVPFSEKIPTANKRSSRALAGTESNNINQDEMPHKRRRAASTWNGSDDDEASSTSEHTFAKAEKPHAAELIKIDLLTAKAQQGKAEAEEKAAQLQEKAAQLQLRVQRAKAISELMTSGFSKEDAVATVDGDSI